MPFELSKETIDSKNSIIIFTFNEQFTETDFNKFLGILDKLFQNGKPFAFLVDASRSTLAPIKCGIVLIKWMRSHKPQIKKYLIGSCLITNYTKLISIMNWVFKHQKPVSPNIITKDYKKGHSFILEAIKKRNEYLIDIEINDDSDSEIDESPTDDNILQNDSEFKKILGS